jgi:hypothetical protein
LDCTKFGERRGRKIWNQPFFKHHPMGDSLQDRAGLPGIWVRHMCHLFWNAPVWALAQAQHSTRHRPHSPNALTKQVVIAFVSSM